MLLGKAAAQDLVEAEVVTVHHALLTALMAVQAAPLYMLRLQQRNHAVEAAAGESIGMTTILAVTYVAVLGLVAQEVVELAEHTV